MTDRVPIPHIVDQLLAKAGGGLEKAVIVALVVQVLKDQPVFPAATMSEPGKKEPHFLKSGTDAGGGWLKQRLVKVDRLQTIYLPTAQSRPNLLRGIATIGVDKDKQGVKSSFGFCLVSCSFFIVFQEVFCHPCYG